MEKSLRAVELAQQAGDPRAEAQARQRITLALTIIGDLEGAQAHAGAGLVSAERLRDRFWWSSALWSNQFVCRLQGDWPASRQYSDRGLEINPLDMRILSDRALLEYELADFIQGQAFLKRLVEEHNQRSPAPTTAYAIPDMVIPLVARINGGVSVDMAQATARAVLSAISASPLVISMARAGLALMSVLQGDVSAAPEQYTALLPQRGTMLQTGAAANDRVLGLVAQTTGNFGQAQAHLEEALDFCRKAGYRAELAWSCCDYANMLLQRDESGDREKAISLLDESRAISSDLGMRPLMERVIALQRHSISQSAKAPAYPDGLSQREVEVLRLVAEGRSNREIADELTISLNTVLRHMSHILAKTRTANRAEVVAYAARRGLVSL